VSSTVNPILYNVMSNRYRRAFRDTLFRCPPRRRQSSHRASVNVAAMTSSFALSAATASFSHDRLRSRLCRSRSTMTSLAVAATPSVRSPSNDELTIHGQTVDTEQLAVGDYGQGRPTATAATGDSQTVLRCDDGAVTSGAIVDTLDVRAIVESRRQNQPMLRRAQSQLH